MARLLCRLLHQRKRNFGERYVHSDVRARSAPRKGGAAVGGNPAARALQTPSMTYLSTLSRWTTQRAKSGREQMQQKIHYRRPTYSITSSARIRNASGTVKPSALA